MKCNNNETNDYTLFNYLKPTENDDLSKLNSSDLQDFIIILNSFYLQLREKIGINNDITFGIEIELEHAKYKKIQKEINALNLKNKYIVKDDCSLNRGCEINSPILKDHKTCWKNIQKVCNSINKLAIVGKNSGGHIHIGTQTLGNNSLSWYNLGKIWQVYENVIYRFLWGEYLIGRNSISKYARPIAENLIKEYRNLSKNSTFQDIFRSIRIDGDKYKAIYFGNVDTTSLNRLSGKNTIEFRCPNSTINPVIWQNNINLLTKLLIYCRSSNYNNDIVEKRYNYNIKNIYYKNDIYNEIFLDQVLEFVDLIFNNNLDKIYFLKQYLKSFEIADSSSKFKKTKVKGFTHNGFIKLK